MSVDRLLSLVSLSARARKACSGEENVEKSIKGGKACLVIVAEDASLNTKKLFKDKCKYYSVAYIEYATKALLGKYVGKEVRASIAITDKSLASGILDIYNAGNQNQNAAFADTTNESGQPQNE